MLVFDLKLRTSKISNISPKSVAATALLIRSVET